MILLREDNNGRLGFHGHSQDIETGYLFG